MTAYFTSFFTLLLNHFAQVLLGCVIYFLLKRFAARPLGLSSQRFKKATLTTAGALSGVLIPGGPYALIPVAAALTHLETGVFLLLPMIISNFLFNVALPMTQTGFVWKGSLIRIGVAALIGIGVGIITAASKWDGNSLFRVRMLKEVSTDKRGALGLLTLFMNCIGSFGLYVIIGTAAEVIFRRYLFYDSLKILYSSSFGAAAIKFMMGYNVTNPLFSVAGLIINRLMDIAALSGLLVMIKPHKLFFLYVYYFIWVILLALPTFFAK